MKRILEPEVMDTEADAIEYDGMDFTEVNQAFAQRAQEISAKQGTILDAGTGTARIPILLSQHCPDWYIIGIDLAQSMLALGQKNLEDRGLSDKIRLDLGDVKAMPYPEAYFDVVLSNSLVHHLKDPLPFFREIKRVLKPQGVIFLRDLLRPPTVEIMDQMVAEIGPEYSPYQKKLFRDSLQAAFTLAEVQQMIDAAGLQGVKVYQSSDRHWSAESGYVQG